MTMTQLPYLNLGCGRIILPAPRPYHHGLVDEGIYAYPLWTNADRNAEPGVDCVMDAFTYPWGFEDNSFDGALLSHLAEHIPHEIRVRQNYQARSPFSGDGEHARRAKELLACQDGWYAFFAELYRVLTPGALVHILSPYGWSQGALTDPSHTRYLTEHAFTHSMQPDPDSPFKYETGGIHFRMTRPASFNITEMFAHLVNEPERLRFALMTQINVVYEMYVQLEVVK